MANHISFGREVGDAVTDVHPDVRCLNSRPEEASSLVLILLENHVLIEVKVGGDVGAELNAYRAAGRCCGVEKQTAAQ